MSPLNSITLLVNGLTLALALGFLIIILWYDSRRIINQFLAIFLIFLMLWNVGSLFIQLGILLDIVDYLWFSVFLAFREAGLVGSSIAIYMFTVALVGMVPKRFRLLAFSSLIFIVVFTILLIVINNTPFEANQQSPITPIFYMLFNSATLYIIWRYHRRVRSKGILYSVTFFLTGQAISLLNPEIGISALGTTIGAIAALLISFALLRREIISPLVERISQVESMHRVSLSIIRETAVDKILENIAKEAVLWLEADATCIFLLQDNELEIVTIHNLPKKILNEKLSTKKGVAGAVASTRNSIYLEFYGRDWYGEEDFPFAKETFGSVICVPLIYGKAVLGVLMVISGKQSQILSRDSVPLLEMLAAQAAVTLYNARLFNEQKRLAEEVEEAHGQLTTVLTSTENPVLALDRALKVLFVNPAAIKLFPSLANSRGQAIGSLLPPTVFPTNGRQVIRDVKERRMHLYELSIGDKTYQCNVAALGTNRLEGWVIVLNDVTQLKELDRFKSEMVRMTSHDLKNPLQAAMAYIDLLKDELSDSDHDKLHYVEMIDKQVEKMERIIRGILDLERVKTGLLSFDECHVEDIIKNVVQEMGYLAEEKAIQLKVSVANSIGSFSGNAEQFQRALVNLVENAIKFSPSKTNVELCVYQNEQEIVFSIRDEGIGIPKEIHQRIFDRFFRGGQKEVEHVSGSGLGLSLVKSVVENHRGRVWLESELGMGTTFFIAVPLHRKVTKISHSH